MKKSVKDKLKKGIDREYKHGFSSNIDEEIGAKGLSPGTVRFISSKKEEGKEMLRWRLDALKVWQGMDEPHWAEFDYAPVRYQDMYYYASPVSSSGVNGSSRKPESLGDVDPEILKTYERLGIPLKEQEMLAGVVAVDAVVDSSSVATTYKGELEKLGIVFCSMKEAVREHLDIVMKYIGKVVPPADNFFAALNSAVFSDGTFVYIPPGVKCPIELGSYFRINAKEAGQFERTLIVADEGSSVSYLEGCSAPQRDENQMHAAVVEIIALKGAEVKYSTVQNWYPGDKEGKGGIFNFVTKRGVAEEDAKISWVQLEVGSALTWKYPSCILKGDRSRGEFFSVAITNNHQKADTGTKMIHIGKDTSSTIISKGVSAGRSEGTYRGLVKMASGAERARNYTKCDHLIIGGEAAGHTFPDVRSSRSDCVIEHEASVSKISDDELFFLLSRGIDEEKAVSLIVNGFASDIIEKLPAEFAMEAKELINISLEG